MKLTSATTIIIMVLYLLLGSAVYGQGEKNMEAAQKLRQFLEDNVSADSPLKADDQFARNELTRLDHLEYARPLKYFEPLLLVCIIHMDPLAGNPGLVLEDIRIIYDPQKTSFVISSLKWINAFREKNPLNISSLLPDELENYIKELVSLLPGADRWGFEVRELEEVSPLSYLLKFAQPHEMNGLGGGREKITFTTSGGILNFPFLEAEPIIR